MCYPIWGNLVRNHGAQGYGNGCLTLVPCYSVPVSQVLPNQWRRHQALGGKVSCWDSEVIWPPHNMSFCTWKSRFDLGGEFYRRISSIQGKCTPYQVYEQRLGVVLGRLRRELDACEPNEFLGRMEADVAEPVPGRGLAPALT